MLDFRIMLELADLDPAETLVVRHVPVEKALRRVLPWLVVSRPDLWLAYQRIQWKSLERAMTRARSIASFIGQEPVTATFAGLYRIGEWRTLDLEGYRTFPGNAELESLGMSGRDGTMGDCLAFDLEALDCHVDWIGRLMIEWPKPYQSWWRRADRASFPVTAITLDSRFGEAIPDWKDMVVSWNELQALPASWRAALAQWRGVYFIFDVERRAGYVGSAGGADNLLGRWLNYARSGHGGNRELRASIPANLRFSILERTSPDLDPASVVALEASWKERLQTRQFGLNLN
jgi:hypothetical protein